MNELASETDRFVFFFTNCYDKEYMEKLLIHEIEKYSTYLDMIFLDDKDKYTIIKIISRYYENCTIEIRIQILSLISTFQFNIFYIKPISKGKDYRNWLLRVVLNKFYTEHECEIKLMFFQLLNTIIKNCDKQGHMLFNRRFIQHVGKYIDSMQRNIFWEEDSRELYHLILNSEVSCIYNKIPHGFREKDLEVFYRMWKYTSTRDKYVSLTNIFLCLNHLHGKCDIYSVITLKRLNKLLDNCFSNITRDNTMCIISSISKNFILPQEYVFCVFEFISRNLENEFYHHIKIFVLRNLNTKENCDDYLLYIKKIINHMLVSTTTNFNFISNCIRKYDRLGSRDIFKDVYIFDNLCVFIRNYHISDINSRFKILDTIKPFLHMDYNDEYGYNIIYNKVITPNIDNKYSSHSIRIKREKIENIYIHKSLKSKCLQIILKNSINTESIKNMKIT